jgi:hypothetical protein
MWIVKNINIKTISFVVDLNNYSIINDRNI